MSCRTCSHPLTLSLAPDSSSESSAGPSTTTTTTETVPDDLLLPCTCHFHWQCLLDHSPTIALSLRCPACDTHLPTPSDPPTIPATYTSEGGPSALDLLPILTEEAFLASNPEARPARALHTLAAEGDVEGMVDLLGDVEEDVVRWRDPLNGGRTALHVAVEAGREEVVWLLLWVGSGVEEGRFPEVVVQLAGEMGVGRGEGVGEDVRGLRDGAGRVAGEVARGMGGAWGGLAEVLTL
ncbi:hypothetical protein B0T18DRAFT_370485 [Schizothecium vesticola]|uniref:Uncharacterized protein n=1 Tax=Schizothecium vesticola TaxID=314040 RepID=A0AA40EP38_9PEZI|nr:hypothetical protein B0T18DRAFT_370485 [Schizothecium vesticola]